MKISKGIFFFNLLVFLCNVSFGQIKQKETALEEISQHWEISATIGANNFLGDLGGNLGIGQPFLKDYMFKTMKPLVGVSATYNLNAWFSFSGGLNFSNVDGADSLINNEGGMERWRFNRNLSFHSFIYEGYATFDFYPMTFFDRTVGIYQVAPFVSGGIGVFHFNPKTQLNGQTVELAPLHLEGQGFPEYTDRKPYSLVSFYIPLVVGVKYFIDNKYALSAGIRIRQTFTDYIDDISTTYIDPTLFDKYLTPDQAILAKQLYSRSLQPWKVKPDIDKAHTKDKDGYMDVFLTFSMRIGSNTLFKVGVH
ncbi:MAG: outer membrane beta-barrel protein [Bacteroidetes bacterium]|nr:outer membrane beta-barrel protein [Bacteroidota bacterium]